jgi:hypothetical protein
MVIDVISRQSAVYEKAVIFFWKRICKLDRGMNPAVDNNGRRDGNDQTDNFFNLCYAKTGPHVRRCDIPRNKGLLIPILSVVASDNENLPIPDLDKLVRTDQLFGRISCVELDGQEFDPTDFEVHTKQFRVNFGNNPIFGKRRVQNSKAVAGGHYLLTEPLDPTEEHTVHFAGEVNVPPGITCLEQHYDEDVTYFLTVR